MANVTIREERLRLALMAPPLGIGSWKNALVLVAARSSLFQRRCLCLPSRGIVKVCATAKDCQSRKPYSSITTLTQKPLVSKSALLHGAGSQPAEFPRGDKSVAGFTKPATGCFFALSPIGYNWRSSDSRDPKSPFPRGFVEDLPVLRECYNSDDGVLSEMPFSELPTFD